MFNIAENDGVYIDPSKTPKTADDIDHDVEVKHDRLRSLKTKKVKIVKVTGTVDPDDRIC